MLFLKLLTLHIQRHVEDDLEKEQVNNKQSNTNLHLFKKSNPQKHIQQFVFYPQKQINPIVPTNIYIYIYNQLTVSCLRQRNLINCQGYLADDQIPSEETKSSEQIHCSVCEQCGN